MRLSRRTWSTALAVTLLSAVAFAPAAAQQTGTVRGTVRDSLTQAGIPGVQVVVTGLSRGATTNNAGEYIIAAVPAGSVTLRAMRIGYAAGQTTVTVTDGGTTTADFTLSTASYQLSNVVAIGYGTSNREDVTGAISSVSGDDIANTPVAGLDAALQGKVPGVQVTQNAGNPGNGITVRIRGPASLNAGNQPLYVVDGVPILQDDFAQLGLGGQDVTGVTGINPDEIASIDILKDAAAAAIYGSRGSNGVVMITTKRGASGAPRIQFNSYVGQQDAARRIDMLNAQQYVEIFNESAANDGYGPEDYDFEPGVDDAVSYDWQDAVFRNAPISNTQLAISGGSERVQYYVSGSFFNQKGIVIGSGYKRGAARVNLDFGATDRLSFRTSIGLSREDNDRVEGDGSLTGIVTNALGMQPMRPVFKDDGSFAGRSDGLRYANPVALAALSPTNLTSLRALGRVEADYRFTDQFRMTGRFGMDVINVDELQLQSPLVDRTYAQTAGGVGKTGYNTGYKYVTEGFATYEPFTSLDNRLSLLGGGSVEMSNSQLNFVRGEGFPVGFPQYVRNAAIITEYDGRPTENALISYFTRANYTLNRRYLFSASLRADGSSRFGPDNRWGLFPAASVGWVVSDEPFATALADRGSLKLRASYGRTGNQEIGDFAARSSATGCVYDDEACIAPSTLGNPNLGWETTDGIDVGMDLRVLGGRVGLIADWFLRETSNLLVNAPVPLTTGFSSSPANFGDMENRGFDFGLETINIEGDGPGGFRWTSNLNATFSRNKVTRLFRGQDVISGVNSRPTSIARVGQPLGAFYMYEFLGVDPATGNAIFGDYDDVEGLSEGDKRIVGNPHPDYFGGLTNEISFRGFDFRTFFQFSKGNDVFNMMRLYADDGAYSYDNKFADVLDRWQEPGDITHVPRMSYDGESGAREISSRFIEDGSYFRIQEITIGYRLPERFSSIANMQSARIYVTGSNLHTFTDYTGYNPDANSGGSGANLVAGTDFYTYPLARTISLGISAGW